jgi:hypothetical protein
MLPLGSDEDVHGDLLRGLVRRVPSIDLIRAQDALYEGAPDDEVLEWAAATRRALITNDRNTMVGLIRRRAAAGQPLPGVIITSDQQQIGAAIDEILLIADCMSEDELKSQYYVFLPL